MLSLWVTDLFYLFYQIYIFCSDVFFFYHCFIGAKVISTLLCAFRLKSWKRPMKIVCHKEKQDWPSVSRVYIKPEVKIAFLAVCLVLFLSISLSFTLSLSWHFSILVHPRAPRTFHSATLHSLDFKCSWWMKHNSKTVFSPCISVLYIAFLWDNI